MRSLSEAFPTSRVDLFVQDGLGNEKDISGGAIIDTGASDGSRFQRMLFGSWRMYHALRRANADIVHFHDPELIPIGILLRMQGVKVVYDIHENLPDQVMAKKYIKRALRRPLSLFVRVIEGLAGHLLSGVVAAGPAIASRFPQSKTIQVRNYPLLAEFHTTHSETSPAAHFFYVVYVGGITEARGITEMLAAVEHVKTKNVRLKLAGAFHPEALEARCSVKPGWRKTDFEGWLDRTNVAQLLDTCQAGLLVLQPTPAYLESLPIKMFEYMAAGLPVIASDFPYWRDLLKNYNCALFVDPADAQAISEAIDWVANNPIAAKEMGAQGKIATEKEFNWQSESEVLVEFYKRCLKVEA